MTDGARSSLVAAFVAQAAVSISEFGLPTIAGFVKHDLGLSAAALGLVISSLTIGKIVGVYAAGVAADRLGEWRVMIIGSAVTGTSVIAASLSPTGLLVVFLMVAGAGAATLTPAGGRAVMSAFPIDRRATAMGIRQTGIPVGGVIAALLIPPIAAAAGWRAGLAVAGAVALAGALVTYLVRPAGGGFETPPAVDATPLERPRFRTFTHSRQIVLLTVWSCLIAGGQYTFVAYIGLQVQQADGTSLAGAAVLVALAQAGGIVGRLGWGFVSDRRLGGRRRPLVVLATASAAGATLLVAVLAGRVPFAILGVVAFAVGVTLFGWQGLWATCMSEAATAYSAGAALGFGLTFVAVANAIAPPAYGLVADLTGSYRAIWVAMGAMLILGLVPARALREPRVRVGFTAHS